MNLLNKNFHFPEKLFQGSVKYMNNKNFHHSFFKSNFMQYNQSKSKSMQKWFKAQLYIELNVVENKFTMTILLVTQVTPLEMKSDHFNVPALTIKFKSNIIK